MKKTLSIFATFMIIAAFAMIASAQVTGDFKVLSATFSNPGSIDGGDVKINGSMNHGALQSGKTVVVEVTYEYSFAYIIPGSTVTIPPRCPNFNDSACANANPNSSLFKPTTKTTGAQTISASSMAAITAPTVLANGRINPKGKTTGWDWSFTKAISPDDSIVDVNLIPSGATLAPGSVNITAVHYKTYLNDADGNQIADTVMTGTLFSAE
jgi:hypothetical protein